MLAVWCAFSPAMHGGWVWDDHSEIVDNPVVHDPAGWWKCWVAPETLDYFPLKTTVQWVQWRLWHEQTAGYHWTNLGLHLAGALLLWRVLGRLGMRCAWVGGLLFAIHPLTVESVVWIAELKNVLSLPLLLLAFSLYLTYDERRRPRELVGSVVLFLVAMLCKSSVVMFPMALLLYAWWKRGRIGRSDLVASAPFFLISLLLGLVTVWFQQQRAIGHWEIPIGGLLSRLALAGTAAGFYFLKTLFPVGLLPIYPRWPLAVASPLTYAPWLLFAAGFVGCWRYRAGWGRHVLFGLGWFGLHLVPVLGFVDMAYLHITWAADHFVYLSLTGVVGLAAAGASAGWTRLGRQGTAIILAGAIGAICVLSVAQDRRYAAVFTSEASLWRYTLPRNLEAWLAHNNLALVLIEQGRPAEALPHCYEAIRLQSGYDAAYTNLALALIRLGRLDEAEKARAEAIRLGCANADLHANLADALLRAGRIADAIECYEAALRLQPERAPLHGALAVALYLGGRIAASLPHYEQAIRLAPTAETHVNYGLALAQLNRLAEAMRHYEEALRLAPDSVEAHYNLGIALARAGRLGEALTQLERTLQLQPDHAEACYNLGSVFARLGRTTEAGRAYREALRLKPDLAEARDELQRLESPHRSRQ